MKYTSGQKAICTVRDKNKRNKHLAPTLTMKPGDVPITVKGIGVYGSGAEHRTQNREHRTENRAMAGKQPPETVRAVVSSRKIK